MNKSQTSKVFLRSSEEVWLNLSLENIMEDSGLKKINQSVVFIPLVCSENTLYVLLTLYMLIIYFETPAGRVHKLPSPFFFFLRRSHWTSALLYSLC